LLFFFLLLSDQIQLFDVLCINKKRKAFLLLLFFL